MNHKSLIEKELDELYKQVDAGQEEGEKAGKIRSQIAYLLKIIAAGGSLVVATGLVPNLHQAIGIAVLIAVFIDTISSNHKRLIASVEAGYAFRSLRSRVKGEFNREASPLYKRKNNGDASVEPEIDELMSKTHIVLSEGVELIQKKKEAADIEALKSLSLDQERAGLSNG